MAIDKSVLEAARNIGSVLGPTGKSGLIRFDKAAIGLTQEQAWKVLRFVFDGDCNMKPGDLTLTQANSESQFNR